MKKIPDEISQTFAKRMKTAKIPSIEQRQYLKWLRFFLDFCEKYNHPEDEPEQSFYSR